MYTMDLMVVWYFNRTFLNSFGNEDPNVFATGSYKEKRKKKTEEKNKKRERIHLYVRFEL